MQKCTDCTTNVVPFSRVNNNELFLEMENEAKLLNLTPSFTIQSLLDEMHRQNFETDEFMGKTITSNISPPLNFYKLNYHSVSFRCSTLILPLLVHITTTTTIIIFSDIT